MTIRDWSCLIIRHSKCVAETLKFILQILPFLLGIFCATTQDIFDLVVLKWILANLLDPYLPDLLLALR